MSLELRKIKPSSEPDTYMPFLEVSVEQILKVLAQE